jgi:hypothetical protein|tara:strand:+ start:1227 stop:1850 length:624 start_codon:yes stop_codon:yes gene_type:complete
MKNYYKALAGFQQECPVLLKDTDGYGYKYVDLTKIIHSINPLMKKHGLGFTQKLGTNQDTGQSCLTTTIFHVGTGESDSSTVDIPLVEMKGQNIYQAFGSGTTYFRRYQLSAQLGVISDKDVDAYGEQEKSSSPIIAPVVKKDKPKDTTSLVELDVNGDDIFTVLHKIIEYKDKGHSFSAIVTGLKKKYTITNEAEIYLKKSFDEQK